MRWSILPLLLFSRSHCYFYRHSRSLSMKSKDKLPVWLTRDAEQKYCKVHPKVIGIDEAGRGPLAGPVVTAACYISNGVFIEGINDSKQTKEEEREAMYEVLIKHPDVHWATSVVSHTEIDEVNILQATMNGMRRSTEDLLKKLGKLKLKGSYIALVDGNRVPTEMPIDAQYVIKGDGHIFSIAAASIIAKVTRDRIMLDLDKEFPQYNLAQHKGYPTFEHRTLLLKHGPCPIHRTSYGPVKLAMQAHANRESKTAAATAIECPSSDTSTLEAPVTGRRKRSTNKVVRAEEETNAAPVAAKKPRTSAAKTTKETNDPVATSVDVKVKNKKVTAIKPTVRKAANKIVSTVEIATHHSIGSRAVASAKKTETPRALKADFPVDLVTQKVTSKGKKSVIKAPSKLSTATKEVDTPRRSTRSAVRK